MMSAAMDTVTKSSLDIALAQEGDISFVYKNMPIEHQAEEVGRVKLHESGGVLNPQYVTPSTTLSKRKIIHRAQLFRWLFNSDGR